MTWFIIFSLAIIGLGIFDVYLKSKEEQDEEDKDENDVKPKRIRDMGFAASFLLLFKF